MRKRSARPSSLERSTRTGNSTWCCAITGPTLSAPPTSWATATMVKSRDLRFQYACHTGSWSLQVHHVAKQNMTTGRPRRSLGVHGSPSRSGSSKCGTGRPKSSSSFTSDDRAEAFAYGPRSRARGQSERRPLLVDLLIPALACSDPRTNLPLRGLGGRLDHLQELTGSFGDDLRLMRGERVEVTHEALHLREVARDGVVETPVLDQEVG